MLFGGARVDGDRHIWWNFVASSRELMEAAKERWRNQRFPPVPDETEFIPLPDDREHGCRHPPSAVRHDTKLARSGGFVYSARQGFCFA
jgi:hypothetical protein